MDPVLVLINFLSNKVFHLYLLSILDFFVVDSSKLSFSHLFEYKQVIIIYITQQQIISLITLKISFFII